MMRFRLSLLLPFVLAAALSAQAATPQEEIRATFDRFVAAQNAHDLAAVETLLSATPDFLWITRGNAVWGRADALKRFEGLYRGTWKLEPESAAFRVVLLRGDVAQLFVPITFTIGPAGETPQQTRFLMNQVLVREKDGWKITSILPIPPPPPMK